MIKVMAVLRTLFLAGIVGYMLWALPLGILLSSAKTSATFNVDILEKVASGGWIAIAWIAMETVFGWFRVWLEGRRQLKALKVAATAAATVPKPGA
jgi:hypothetical protein